MGLDQWIEDENGKELIYWRKVNCVNNWVNKNVGTVENCERVEITIEQLKELKETCQKVLENNSLADEILPTQSGFFFGSIDYDKWYFNDLEYTISVIDELLKNEEFEGNLYYVAWW